MVNNLDIPVRLASVLLISNAQITMSEIQSLPFVNNREEANAVAQNLMSVFGPRYRIEVTSGIGRADIKLSLETAQASPALHDISARRSPFGRRASRPRPSRQRHRRVDVLPIPTGDGSAEALRQPATSFPQPTLSEAPEAAPA